ncbi:hypothetical protein M0R89_06835 [Halorussus limi]|uniref:CARDB domain-containing protein n=1 Tax=Halorussus limi TaxID=2938695 RepID=A0A8U0HY52_9EURY|nr:hypothetical protein [Halorussus limi]UPV75769.1 hypothetical protein M0R89_06835 [Halorussus limi]
MERRRLLALGATAVTSGCLRLSGGEVTETRTETATGPDVTITSVSLPDTMRPGREYTARTTLRNTADAARMVTVTYQFEGQKTLFSDVRVPAGGSKTTSYAISPVIVETSYGSDIDVGTYTHGIRLSNGGRETASVSVKSSDIFPEKLSVGSLEAPTSVPLDEKFTVATTVSNAASQAAIQRVEYRFEGKLVFSRNGVRIEPNGETRVGFGPSVDDIETTLGHDLSPGTYSHELVVPDVGRASGRVELTEGGLL